jgi:small subunit ribosomal protein S16
MKRLGRKHRPFYRVCVMDSRAPRDGRAIEEVGTYDTSVREKAARVNLNLERIDYWLSVGAQPSDKVATLIKKVRTNRFGTVKQAPPMQAPKQPEPEAPPAEEAAASEPGEAAPEEAVEAPAEENAE